MARITTGKLSTFLDSELAKGSEPFSILRKVAILLASPESYEQGHELVLRCMDRREYFRGCDDILQALVRSIGLFPHVDIYKFGTGDKVAWEFHRPENAPNEQLVLHRSQASVYRRLVAGNNVILSAPTSFGKSLLLDTMIATYKHQNIAIIVPTIALMDETRRRLATFSSRYKIVTHTSQSLADRNIFVVTQERLLEFESLPKIDFFAIDEFYKLDPEDEHDNRSILLNQVFYKLLKHRSQFFLLGPGIEGVVAEAQSPLQCEFIKDNYRTVATDVFRVQSSAGNELESLLTLLSELQNEQTLVFCKSPARVREISQALTRTASYATNPLLRDAADWISRNYHPDWHVGKALGNGIGCHHAQLPRSIGRFMVRMFNEGKLSVLCCTSTLIEGVNTSAKNVVIFDHKIAKKKFDYFTYNNIAGRSGRMMRHFVGRVFLFHDAPTDNLPLVDFPAISQSPAAPPSLLLQITEDDLQPASLTRLRQFVDNDLLPLRVLRMNRAIDPVHQLELAEDIVQNISEYAPLLAWTGMPKTSQLQMACDLIWKHFVRSNQRQYGVSSGRQLAYRLNSIRLSGSMTKFIEEEVLNGQYSSPDEAIEVAMGFVRHWVSFAFPRFLTALDNIQRHLLESRGYEPGIYSNYAGRVENVFMPSVVTALDEYGIPVVLGQKLHSFLKTDDDLDLAISRVKSVSATVVSGLKLSLFESDVLTDAISGM